MEHTRECEPCVKCYKSYGCRCRECNRANNEYELNRQRIRRRPDSGWDDPKVPADRARNHLIWLATKGIGTNAIHRRTGITTHCLSSIRSGRRKIIYKHTEQIIISQAVGMYDIAPADAIRAKRWVRKLKLPRAFKSDHDEALPEPEIDEETFKRIKNALLKEAEEINGIRRICN